MQFSRRVLAFGPSAVSCQPLPASNNQDNLMKIVIFLFAILTSINTYGQIKRDSIEINLSGRVDTTDVNIKQIYNLFKTYLETRPDSIRINPCWNMAEQSKGLKGNVALFYTPFYNLGADPKTIFSIWKPFILSIEPKSKEKYLIRVALIKKEDEPDKILTIINVNAIYESDKWVLQNTINDVTEGWRNKPYKYLNYFYPSEYLFNEKLAEKSITYCDSIVKILKINSVDNFSYFVCDNTDHMGQLFGYEFYYLNYTTGLTIKWRNEIYSSKNSEFYPHEFMHMLFTNLNNDSINYIIEEGLACFLGELGTEKYTTQILKLANDYLSKKPTYTLDNLLNNSTSWNGYQTAYPTGSILAEITYEKSGYEGIRKLIQSNTTVDSDIYKAIRQITKLNKTQLEREFTLRLKKYVAIDK